MDRNVSFITITNEDTGNQLIMAIFSNVVLVGQLSKLGIWLRVQRLAVQFPASYASQKSHPAWSWASCSPAIPPHFRVASTWKEELT